MQIYEFYLLLTQVGKGSRAINQLELAENINGLEPSKVFEVFLTLPAISGLAPFHRDTLEKDYLAPLR